MKFSVEVSGYCLLMVCKAEVVFEKVCVLTKNGLDFQLATYLGYLVAKEKNASYTIVSKDSDFKVVVDFWIKRDLINKVGKDLEVDRLVLTKNEVYGLNENELKEADKIIKSSKDKGTVHNEFIKKFGRYKGREVYQNIKNKLNFSKQVV